MILATTYDVEHGRNNRKWRKLDKVNTKAVSKGCPTGWTSLLSIKRKLGKGRWFQIGDQLIALYNDSLMVYQSDKRE